MRDTTFATPRNGKNIRFFCKWSNMWSDQRFNEFSAIGSAEKVSVFKGFRLYSKNIRRERWLSPEPCALPAALHLDLVIHYITVEMKKSRCKINNINIKDNQTKICLKNIEKRGIFSCKKIFLKIFQKSVDKQKILCYNLTRRKRKSEYGSIAQLGEHLPYKQRVIGSSPIVSTIWSGSSAG